MKNVKKLGMVAFVVAVCGIATMAVQTASAVLPGRCICPDVYRPVLCPNGVTYSNSCFASCAGQRNCVPGDAI